MESPLPQERLVSAPDWGGVGPGAGSASGRDDDSLAPSGVPRESTPGQAPGDCASAVVVSEVGGGEGLALARLEDASIVAAAFSALEPRRAARWKNLILLQSSAGLILTMPKSSGRALGDQLLHRLATLKRVAGVRCQRSFFAGGVPCVGVCCVGVCCVAGADHCIANAGRGGADEAQM